MRLLTYLFSPGLRGVWVGIASALLVWGLTSLHIFVGMEEWMLDGAFITRGKRPTRANVVIIAIDEVSLRKLGKSTSYLSPELARVVSHARAQGASAIGIDLLVPEDMSNLPDIEKAGAPGDARPMGRAIRDAGNVVLAQRYVSKDEIKAGVNPWLRPLTQWQLKALDDPAETDLASVHLHEDGDQFVRRLQLLGRDEIDGEPVPILHFALALYLVKNGQKLRVSPDGIPEIRRKRVPVDVRGLMLINYVGPPGSFPTIPFHEALEAAKENKPLPQFANALVLIGVTARSLQDYHATPYANDHARWLPGKTSGRMSGPEVQANAYATLEDDAFIHVPSGATVLITLLVMGMVLGYVTYRAGLVGGLGIIVVHHFLCRIVAFVLFAWLAFRLPVVGMLLLGVVLYAITLALRWQQVRAMMRVFMARAIADWFENDPSRLRRKLDEREVTVLFADIRGFSTFSDCRPPREVAQLLMDYFDVIVPIIDRNGGTLNQYMGDGIMVLFGATSDQPDQAVRAVRTAVEMVRAVRRNAALWAERGMIGLRIGVGINTGNTVVGAISAANLMDFTAIGDTTNIAARIEALNKEQDTEILLSDRTYNEVPQKDRETLGCESQGRAVHVKGKREKFLVHAVDVDPRSDDAAVAARSGVAPV